MNSKYGVDIAARRLDDLDRSLLADIATAQSLGKQAAVLTLGCGAAGLERQLVALGAAVTAVDKADFTAAFAAVGSDSAVSAEQFRFIQSDMAVAVPVLANEPFTHIVLQRSLHYLPYQDALHVLKALSAVPGRRCYVAVTGCETAIGRMTGACTLPVTQRFTALPAEAQTTFSISEKLCPYEVEEFADVLTRGGWTIEQQWTSAFGNHKAIATSS